MRKTAIILIVSLLLTLISLPANSQNKLIKINKINALVDDQSRAQAQNLGLYGGQSEDIEVDPTSNNVYITTMAPNGFFVSTDKGESFRGLPSNLNLGTGKQVEVNSANGDVYALIGDSLLKSTNKGATFTDISRNLGAGGALGQQLIYGNNRLLVAKNPGPGSNSNLAVSSNGGSSFSSVTIGDGTGQLMALAASSATDTFYAAISNNNSEKLYRSTDGGSNWTEVSIPAGQRISVVAVDPYDANHIVITNTNGDTSNSIQSTNGGSSWSALIDGSQPVGNQNVAANYVAFDGERMYIGHAYTTNRGASWGRISSQTPLSSVYADKFASDPNNRNVLFTNSVYGLAKSTDRGVTWADKVTGVASVKVYDISQANNKGVVYIAANGGLAKTTNFTSSSPDWLYPLAGTGSATVSAVWVKPNDPNVVLFGDHNWIKKSTDGGASWSVVATMGSGNPGPGNIQEITSVPGNNNILYAALSNDDLARTDTGFVFKSTDGGSTWTDLNVPGNASIGSLTVAKDGDVYIGASSRDTDAPKGIYKYSGGSWTKLSGGAPDFSVTSVLADPENANVVMATANSDTGSGADNGGLYKSTNGGSSWSKITRGLTNVNNLDSLIVQTSTSPNTFYLAAQDQSRTANSLNGVIYKSTDGGNSWGEFYMGLKQESFYALLFDGLTAGNDRGLYDIKSKASVSLTVHQRIIKKVKRKGKVRNKVVYKKIKTAKKGQVVSLKIALADAATKKKLSRRTVLVYKKVIIKKKVKKKWRRLARWKRVKKVRLNKSGYTFINARLSTTSTYYVLWKPGNKVDKAEYTTSKSKNVKVKVRR